MSPREQLSREAIRLHERYHREFIERFALCPWAKSARVANRTRAHVVTVEPCHPKDLLPVLKDWDEDDSVDVAFVIAPRFSKGAEDFSDWAASIGELLGDRFMTAPFYPDVEAAAQNMVYFLRQSPDPTVQLVRRTRLEQVRAQDPPHYSDIFKLDLSELDAENAPRTVAASVMEHNKRVIEKEGPAQLQSILDDIRADRDRTYAALFPLLEQEPLAASR